MVELITQAGSDNVVVEKTPALIAQTGICRSEPLPGKYHCLFSEVDGELVVWDLGGGMFVNGVQTSKATMRAGDKLRLGGVDFTVKQPRPTKRYRFGVRT